jgi:hypothetical protein
MLKHAPFSLLLVFAGPAGAAHAADCDFAARVAAFEVAAHYQNAVGEPISELTTEIASSEPLSTKRIRYCVNTAGQKEIGVSELRIGLELDRKDCGTLSVFSYNCP